MCDGVTIHIPGAPVPKGRPRFMRIGREMRAYTPKETDDYETACRWYMKKAMAGRALFDCALIVSIECSMPIPQSWSQRKKDHAALGSVMPTGRPDVDNTGKSVLDAANGFLYRDDAQIVDLRITKKYGEPGVTITVTPLGAPIVQERAA